MLPKGAIVGSVYAGKVIGHAPKGAILTDFSTIDMDTGRAAVLAAQQAGYDMVDAPVSGGIAAASAGTLAFMVGGYQGDFAMALMLKVLSLAMEAAILRQHRASGAACKGHLQAFAKDHGALDFSAVINSL